MQKMSKSLLFGFILIIMTIMTVSVSLADIESDIQFYSKLQTTSWIDEINGYNGTTVGSTTTTLAKINNGASFDNNGDGINFPTQVQWSRDITVCTWFKLDSTTDVNWLLGKSNDTGFAKDGIHWFTPNTMRYQFYQSDMTAINNDITFSDTSSEHSLCLVRNETHSRLYLDSVSNTPLSYDGTTNFNQDDKFWLGFIDIQPADQSFDGWIDETYIYNRSFTSEEIEEWHNRTDNLEQYPFTTDIVPNESVESTAVVKQIGAVVINTPGDTTVFSSDFNVTVNNSDLYGAYSFNVESNAANTLSCRLEIDSVTVGTIVRSNDAGVLGSVYLQSEFFSLESGTHNQALICSRSAGGGSITITNAVGIGHFMIDENNLTIPHDELITTNSTSDSLTFTLLNEFDFTISNRSIGGFRDVAHMLVLEWAGQYTNNGGSSELLNTVISINGSNCSFYPRTVSAGGTGSVSGDCLIKNATTSDTYNIKVYGQGSNAEFTMDVKAKEFILSNSEIEGGTGFPVNTTFSGDTDIRLFNFTGGNQNHESSNVFEKVAFSISANESTTALFYVKLINGETFQTINFTRDITTDVGVLIGHDILENVTQDDYNVELWANCGSSSAECTISGGDGIGYLTDVTETQVNAFTITANDNYDNSTIFEFTATDGSTLTTDTGSLLFFTTAELENITITSDFLGGYFSRTILNHNTSEDLNVIMNQTEVRWNCVEKVSAVDLTCDGPLETTIFNYNVLNNPHTQSVNVTGYYENIELFNVTGQQNNTLNSIMYSSNVSLLAQSDFAIPLSCNYTTVSNDYTFTETDVGAPNITIGLINGSYNVSADCAGFSIDTLSLTVDDTTEIVLFNLTPTNSVNVTFRDSDTGNILDNITITVNFIGDTSFTNTTSVGWLFQDLFSPDDYTITAIADGYRQTEHFFTLLNRTFNPITVYMQKENNSQLVLITVRDRYSKTPIQNSQVTVQRWRNGSWFTDQILTTDFNGQTEAHYILSTVFYNHIVDFNGENFFGTINSNEDKKVIYTEDVNNGIFIEIDINPNNVIPEYQQIYGVTSSLNWTNTSNSTGTFRYSWNDEDNIDRTGNMFVTKEGIVVCNETLVSEAGTLFCNVNITDGEGLTYFFASTSIDGLNDLGYIATLGVNDERDVDFGALGYLVTFFIMLIFWTMFLNVPNISIYITSGLFVVLIVFGMAFKGVNLTVWSLIMFLAFIIGRVVSKQGVNA